MANSPVLSIAHLLKGLIAAVLLTLLCMLLMAIIAVYGQLSDNAILWLNQLIKIAAILTGVTACVGRAGQQGFVKGMALAIIYMICGYVLYLTLGGHGFDVVTMLGEILLGAAIGGVAGAILANLSPKKPRRKK